MPAQLTLIRLRANDPTFESLALPYADLEDLEWEALLEGVITHDYLRHIDLSGNPSVPWDAVAKALHKHKSLKAATFVSAGIDATQAKALPLAGLVKTLPRLLKFCSSLRTSLS